MEATKKYSVEDKGDYIHLKTWGKLELQDLDAPVNAALALAKEKGISNLVDDIRDIDTTNLSIPIQAKSVGILWKLRAFKKVAIIFKGDEIGWLLTSSLDAMHLQLSSHIKGFDNVDTAVKWLRE